MRPVLVIACTLSLCVAVQADGLVYRLPADGILARYDFEFEGSFGEDKQIAKGTVTLASVGKAVVDKENCRWIELHMQITQRGRAHGMLAKMLIPEKRLKAGEKILDHVVKGWIREDDEREPDTWATTRKEKKDALQMFLTDPLQDVKKLPKQTIESKLGKLECEGIQGVIAIDIGRGKKMRVSYENRLHEKAPFGVVTSKMQFIALGDEGKVEGVILGNLRLLEVEKDAKSQLPDHK
jgi:hypothetical protein